MEGGKEKPSRQKIQITSMIRIIKVLLIFSLAVWFFGNSISSSFAAISFTISNLTINSNDEIEVDAVITGLTSSSNCSTDGCYLQAEILSAGGAFGYTYNNSGDYVDFFKPSSVEEIKSKLFNFKPVEGAWSGKLKAKNNPESSNYYGSGEYAILFRRFTGNSKSPTSGDSNALAITLISEIPTPTPNPTAVPTPAPTPTPLTLKTSPPTLGPTPTPSPTPKKLATPRLSSTPETILGEAIESGDLELASEFFSPEPTPTGESQTKNKFPFFAVIPIILGIGLISSALYLAYKKNKTSTPDSLV